MIADGRKVELGDRRYLLSPQDLSGLEVLPELIRAGDAIGENEDYHRIATLAASLKPEELLTLDAETILHRLFWEEDVRRFEPQVGAEGPRFACTCSRERVSSMLRSLGRDEVESIIAEQGGVEVGCDFCGAQYRFDPVDAAQVFLQADQQPPVNRQTH